jgi:hypothetical protein
MRAGTSRARTHPMAFADFDLVICDIDGCLTPERLGPLDDAALRSIAEHNLRAERDRDRPEATVLDRFHWWPAGDLAQSSERLTPLSLAQIVGRYIADGAPRGPIKLELLVD